MTRNKQKPARAVIFVHGGLVQDVYFDTPLEAVILDYDEHSQDRWVISTREGQPMSEMPKALAKQYKKMK